MPLKRKFLEEMDYLSRLRRVFTRDNPQLARFLGEEANDPDVERLIEALAFLTAKLRLKIDDDLPELTHAMLQLLWPNYLRPLPSAVIIRFEPLPQAVTSKKRIAKGTEVGARPVDNIRCRFRTCTEVDVFPFVIHEVSDAHTREKSILRIDLALPGTNAPSTFDCDALEFHLSGSDQTALTLYLWLAQYVGEFRMECGGTMRRLSTDQIVFPGFSPSEALLPYPKNAFDGYRILQEYFIFPKRFQFFRLTGLQKFWPGEAVEHIRFELHFRRPMPPDIRVRTEDLALYCTPAVNLFKHDAEPISLDGTAVDQRVVPSGHRPDAYEIFSIDEVNSTHNHELGQYGKRQRTYQSFESLQHEIEHAHGHAALYYRARIEPALEEEGVHHRISFVRGDETEFVGKNETVSLSLTCTNRDLPLALAAGDICVKTQTTPDFATYHNLGEPTPSYRPVLNGQLQWRLISNLSLNYLSLQSADPLKAILAAYDFAALHDIRRARTTRKRLDAIGDAVTKPIDRLVHGLPVRGMKTVLRMDPNGFLCEGDMYLFGTALSHFFSLYSSINSFHLLEIVNTSNQERYTWSMRIGQQPLM
ncbi:type VI secretion system baseplate subunit TssF [Burkholderia sp. Bp8963]|uniref:type VI secretion system baseplate subunit TssF n=1 Tax=Burkholderia sp. Bp8963 TaxID=2184547 RepID=UPI000F5A20E4|nr:type VI secretion system baseplate subunit TssF [Burkholderia sp. Bp8963]RQS75473.1 type VI secretion system baseplate subunit TssF [Burkholderia sp. Bp8963]